MARKSAPGTLIHCDACGEDYSATYKRCPFCGEKPGSVTAPLPSVDDEDEYVFEGQDLFDDEDEDDDRPARSRGGKRLAQSDAPGPINWPRLITFICSLVIIAAALVIVFAYIYPKIHTPSDPTPGVSDSVTSPSPDVTPSADPSADVTDPAEPSDDPISSPSADPVESPSQTVSSVTGLSLNKTDFTLPANASYTIKATVSPAGWEGEVTWSSSNEKIATVSADGTVTNVNTGSSLQRVTITAAAGDKTAQAVVYCNGNSSASGSDSGSGGGTLAAGASGKITGASSGLRVRSGPGTSYDVVASLVNGSKVTVVAAAEDGWYQITFIGEGGRKTVGYILGEYISVS